MNYRSRGRGLLCLYLFSDVAGDCAPTRIRLKWNGGRGKPVGVMIQSVAINGHLIRKDRINFNKLKPQIRATGPKPIAIKMMHVA